MEKVKYREFIRNTSKYMKIGSSYHLDGKKPLIVKIEPFIIKTKEDVKKVLAPVQDSFVLTYGCGCVKGDKPLCPKHGRA